MSRTALLAAAMLATTAVPSMAQTPPVQKLDGLVNCAGINIFAFITSGDTSTALELDKKIDDGDRTTGRLTSTGCFSGGNNAGYIAGKRFNEP